MTNYDEKWQACQAFARNSEPPISATEFLRTPNRLSGFEFEWPLGPAVQRQATPPITPPQIDELPPLTPASDEGDGSDHSDLDTPTRHDIFVGEEMETASHSLYSDTEISEQITGQEVEFDKTRMPMPPVLMPAPSGKNVTETEEKEAAVATAEPMVQIVTPVESGEVLEPVVEVEERGENPMRYYKGVKSLSTFEALLKHKSTEKGGSFLYSLTPTITP